MIARGPGLFNEQNLDLGLFPSQASDAAEDARVEALRAEAAVEQASNRFSHQGKKRSLF